MAVGPVTVRAAKDCPIAGRDLPLVVISHGFGGSFVGHRDVAEALADTGFIVVVINHPAFESTQQIAEAADMWITTYQPLCCGQIYVAAGKEGPGYR